MSTEIKILKFAIEYKQSHNGNSPSYTEIMDACGISSKSYLKALLDDMEKDGLLERNGVRGIVIPNSEWQTVEK